MLKNAVCPQNVRKSDIFAPNFIFYARKFSEKIVFFFARLQFKKVSIALHVFTFCHAATKLCNSFNQHEVTLKHMELMG